jgi:hypothetical protein
MANVAPARNEIDSLVAELDGLDVTNNERRVS